MNIVRDLSKLPAAARSGAASIGNFDGVHRGHAHIVERLIAAARRANGPAVVFTFDPHPVRILRPEQCPPPLTWTERKAQLLAALGVDWVIAYPTDAALLSLTSEEFFDRIVRESLDARSLVEGPNFCFGRGRTGTIARLGELCGASGVTLEVVQPVADAGEYVSSSRIRTLIAGGQVEEAAAMLTEPYRVRGLVVHGAGRGAPLGFATANVDAIDTILPAPGVYAGKAYVAGTAWPAAINIGPQPTFGEASHKVEAHLIGFGETLYGQVVEVDFRRRLRDIVRFASVDELREQLARDIENARNSSSP